MLTLWSLGHNKLIAQSNVKTVSVKNFGALGDGSSNDTKAIQAAIDNAMLQGAKVILSSGTYLVTGLKIATSLEGIGNVTIKRIPSNNNGQYDFCVVGKRNNLSFNNIVFDANSNSLKGSVGKGIPLFIYSSQNISISNCKFLNSSMAGLRIENSSNISIDRSEAGNSKGNFGDGFYFAKSQNITVKNSAANNYTRIGFVVENGSSEITFDNCKASFGTNASILRGGTEYNAGFWYENSWNVYTKNCVASKNTHMGFVASGIKDGLKLAVFTFNNCMSLDNPIGFRVGSNGNVPINAKITKGIAKNVDRGFIATAKNLNDTFEFDDCEAYMNKIPNGSLNNIGFMWESPVSKQNKGYTTLPIFIYSRSKIFYNKNEKTSALTDSKSNSGDISTYTGGRAKIVIQDVSNSLTNTDLFLKSRRGNPQYLRK